MVSAWTLLLSWPEDLDELAFATTDWADLQILAAFETGDLVSTRCHDAIDTIFIA